MSEGRQEHDDVIIEQFSRQALPFARVPGHLDGIDLLIELAHPEAGDVALDVACGPGLVTCAFAPKVSRIEGLDITAAMIDAARQRQQQAGLVNVSWRIGAGEPLPYPDNSFDLVMTRYSFHHLLHPRDAIAEMIRVCRPGGRVLAADVVLPREKAAAYDRLEKIRDPSHVRVLTTGEMDGWFSEAGLISLRQVCFGVDFKLEDQLCASFPAEDGQAKLRQMLGEDVGVDVFGVRARCVSGEIHYTVPVVAIVGQKSRINQMAQLF